MSALLAMPGSAHAAAQVQTPPADTSSPSEAVPFHVYLVTVGQGDAVWEKFGHNMIWLLDQRGSINLAYNWGIFDFDQPGYYKRLMQGSMLYTMEPYNGVRMVNAYIAANRTVWAQELNLTDAEKLELKSLLDINALPENKDYIYDYYRDNCSTRVRDMIDRVTGGALRAQLAGRPTGTTLRWHTQRLTADVLLPYTGLLLAMGPFVDRPIDAWEESFLPVQLMNHVSGLQITAPDGTTRPLVLQDRLLFEATRPAEPSTAPQRTPWYALAGVLFGGLLLLLDRASRRTRIAAVGFFVLAMAWSLVAGIFGTIIALIWAFTNHVATFSNENVLQVNVLSLVLLAQLALVARGRARRAAWAVATSIAALAAIGLVMTVLPLFPQHNGPIVALALPIHVALAVALQNRLRLPDRAVAVTPAETKRKAA